MISLDIFISGLHVALEPSSLAYCMTGVFLGTLIGAMPGIGALTAISLLLPFSASLPLSTALILLAGVYYGAEYGGSVSSILLNIPGTPSAAVTCLEGYPMAISGRGGPALIISALSSFIGGILGVIAVIAFAPILSKLVIYFGPAEFSMLILLSLVATCVVTQENPLKSLCTLFLGILLSTIGIDIASGQARFTFGITELRDGISLVIIAIGFFGFTEVLCAQSYGKARHPSRKLRDLLPSKIELRDAFKPTLRGGLTGIGIGTLPGSGPTLASFLAYYLEKTVSGSRHKFGQGSIPGLAGPEAANNAAAQTAFVPTLSLGIPGSASMALIIGALMMHGVSPGPGFITEYSDVFWSLIVSFLIGNIFLLFLNIPLLPLWLRIVDIPFSILYPAILVIMCVAAFVLNQSVLDVSLVLIFGVFGWMLRLHNFPLTPILIGFVLAPLLEENFRQALSISQGTYDIFLSSPSSVVLIFATVILALHPILKVWIKILKKK